MNWQAITFDWNQARAFLVTAEEGTFSAAARALNVTQPTLGRQVAAFEDALGVTLFDRVGRSVKLTEAGVHLRDHMRRMADAAADMSLAAAGQSQRIEGVVRLTSTDVMAVDVLPDIIARIHRTAPGIEIEVQTSITLSDLRRRESDIALRHTRPQEPELICRKVAETTAHLYASHGWITRHGRPKVPEDLHNADFIVLDRTDRMRAFLVEMGISGPQPNLVVTTQSGILLRELVRRGVGIGFLAREMAGKLPDLECVLPDLPPIPVPLWLTAHRDLITSARVRLVYDILAEELTVRG